MIDLATAPRARLYTTWGTVLFVDADTGELRHGPIDTSPENAVFVADPTAKEPRRQGWLMHVAGEKLEPIACGALSCRAVDAADVGDPPAAGAMLELMPLERGLIAFSAESQFLCAQPDGRVDLSKPWCSTWECFLASEGWCSTAPAGDGAQAPIDWKNIRKMLIDPRLRMKANAGSAAARILIYGYPYWSHGRVYHDICKYLHHKGYIVDIINWQVNHADYIGELKSFYDFFISALDGVSALADVYGVPYEQIIAISHHEMDMRALIDQKGVEIFDKFAGYCVVGYQLFDASAIFGIMREPMVVQIGVDFSEFFAEIPERLATVGYASSFWQKTIHGVEIKRGRLVEAAAREAGLGFKVAGSTADQTSIHDMPEFYRSVDAILVSSVTEGAQLPIREAAAAGRLVISTPVGDFPLRAYQGTGIIAPIESEKYRKFAAAQLQYYKDNPEAFVDVCRKTQNTARQLDWEYMIDDWVQLIETAQGHVLELARSHQQAGRFADAARVFAKRADCGGDEEEKWYARWQHARCLRALKDEDGFVQTALQAFCERPHRAEPLHDLANYYLDTQRAGPAAFYADAAQAIPKPEQDRLFDDLALYDFGLSHTFTVAASWSDDLDLKERGRKVCDWLALSREVPDNIRDPARYNSGWYAVAAQSLLPSLQFYPLSVPAAEGFHAANLGVCRWEDRLVVMVRTVNWILADGRYALLSGNDTHRSHLVLLELDRELRVVSSANVLPPEDLPPPRSKEDLGFRDPRPFVWRGQLWCICAFRELNDGALAEMVLARVDDRRPDDCVLADWRIVPSGMPARWEGNWMPQVVGDELRLIYTVDPTRILSDWGAVLHNEPAPISAENFRGGSQAVAFDSGWLMVIHEVEHINGQRRYFHRFIWMDAVNTVRRLSRRFYLCQLGYEFVAGMAWHPDNERLVISLSLDDFDAFLAVVGADDVRATLFDVVQHEQASQEAIASGGAMVKKVTDCDGAGFMNWSLSPATSAKQNRSTSPESVRIEVDWVTEQTNRALRNYDAVRHARAATLKLGLPLHPTLTKAWDNFLAVIHALATTELDSPVLDAGAGRESAFLPGLHKLGFKELVGINLLEAEPEMVDGVCYRHGDITNTDFAEGQFGFVACLSVIEHGVDWRQFLQEMTRILRPRGHLFVSMDYWQDPIDVGDRMAFGVPVKIFTSSDVSDLVQYASDLGLSLVGDLDLNCEQRVANWMGLDFTFYNLLFRQSSDPFAFSVAGQRDEKAWSVCLQQARRLRDLKDEEGFVRKALQAFRERPHRAEPLHDLAHYYLDTERAAPAVFCAEAAMALPKPENDVLLVNESLYETGLRHTFTAAASWSDNAEQKERGRVVCNWMAMSREVPPAARGAARYNLRWYSEAAQSLMPSLQFYPLSIAAPIGFKPGNVSIMRDGGGFILAARLCTHTLLANGYYDRHGDTCSRSRVLLVNLDQHFKITSETEVLEPEDMPLPRHPEFLGLEDARPFVLRDELWAICCTCQLNSDGRPELLIARIDRSRPGRCIFTDWRVLTSGMPVRGEKNWMPQVIGNDLRFVYSVDPTCIITDTGIVLHDEAAQIAVENFKGGSQAIPFDGGWLMVIHEWEWVNGRRNYLHRLIWFDENNHLCRLSRRFFFKRISGEFASGIAWHVNGERLVISFAVDERDPCLAVVSANDIRGTLWDIAKHERTSQEAIAVARATLRQLIDSKNEIEANALLLGRYRSSFLKLPPSPAQPAAGLFA